MTFYEREDFLDRTEIRRFFSPKPMQIPLSYALTPQHCPELAEVMVSKIAHHCFC